MRISRRRARAGRCATPALLIVPALLLAVACTAEQAAPAAEQAPPPTVELLAAEAGCTPKIQIDAKELRQGYCTTSIGQFFITTFATQKGKDEWMDQAPEYSPHLVGNLWTALAPRPVLDKLRQQIGGDLHLMDHRKSPTPAG
ncbi:hypothetical protein Psi02_12130 [Planotetraspora silvatica]|uniref:DUF3558 domain-containing protein n=1 Tax=Planotetraspora silvatica TaxID=234614 RepID=A0A8J3UM41_9ACTN|nr:hypothetical protein [Planotetraspora silvatica]GII44789.1 hypothetical protein Psi02_12130 [Planotetraspora silvatica]